MNKYTNLEISILSCLIQKPELMEKINIDDKYFIKHQKIWKFMKSFYKKYKNFDFHLMMAISDNKYRMGQYIEWLVIQEPIPEHIFKYIDLLKEQYEENKKEKWIIDKIFTLSNDLYMRNITIEEFKNKTNKIYTDANKIYEKGE